jgi:hypothetical protein
MTTEQFVPQQQEIASDKLTPGDRVRVYPAIGEVWSDEDSYPYEPLAEATVGDDAVLRFAIDRKLVNASSKTEVVVAGEGADGSPQLARGTVIGSYALERK